MLDVIDVIMYYIYEIKNRGKENDTKRKDKPDNKSTENQRSKQKRKYENLDIN
ncbi:MAG: hypothetical protein M0P71_17435 [Melioribacteraceae bacterium]|nr:hypothetical protein [Melioribacteraceae bacterium]